MNDVDNHDPDNNADANRDGPPTEHQNMNGALDPGQVALGPLDYIIKMGLKAHPALRYGVAVLGLVAIGVAMFRITAGVKVDTGGVRTIGIIVLLMLALMLLFFMFANAVDPNNKIALWVNRIISAFLPPLVLIGLGWAAWLGLTERNCELAVIVKGAEASECDNLPARIEGSVLNFEDEQQFMDGAQVVLRRGRTVILDANEAGDFSYSFHHSAIGKELKAWAKKEGYQRANTIRMKLDEGLNEIEIKLKPVAGSDSGQTKEKFKYIPEYALKPKLNPDRLEEGEIYSDAGLAGPVQPREGILRMGAFNGENFRYDIFYCQSPVGNTIKSKILASQLKTVLNAQKNVSQVRVRVWPVRRVEYDLALGTSYRPKPGERIAVILNTRPERSTITRQLRGLWAPYLENGEVIVDRSVSTSYPGYMSVVACRA
ncbi:MAG: hypothetical protein COA41_14570 [Sphingopyxis sp.]|nr:MAG: hypothetical protein COA41_14570 [Sphingopyxis sp.]